MHKFSGTFCSGFILSYPVQDGDNELIFPIANERQYFLVLYVVALYGRI